MASIITATTTNGLVSSADNSGVLQLSSGVGNLVTIPAVTGTAMVSANMPAFSVFASATQNFTFAVTNIIQLNSETFDTASRFNNTGSTVGGIPAYSFLPNVEGYYQINATIMASGYVTGGQYIPIILKNGATFYNGTFAAGISGNNVAVTVSGLVYCNGSTDYIQLGSFCGSSSGTRASVAGAANTFMNGCLVRSA